MTDHWIIPLDEYIQEPDTEVYSRYIGYARLPGLHQTSWHLEEAIFESSQPTCPSFEVIAGEGIVLARTMRFCATATDEALVNLGLIDKSVQFLYTGVPLNGPAHICICVLEWGTPARWTVKLRFGRGFVDVG